MLFRKVLAMVRFSVPIGSSFPFTGAPDTDKAFATAERQARVEEELALHVAHPCSIPSTEEFSQSTPRVILSPRVRNSPSAPLGVAQTLDPYN